MPSPKRVWQGDIELHDIKFRYPARPDAVVFGDLNLAIQVPELKKKRACVVGG
jgi:hypothetical protein